MANSTWNYPCYQPHGWGTGDSTHGMVWILGARNGTTQPFTNSMTAIFSFFQRTGWSNTTGDSQGLIGIGARGAADSAFRAYLSGVNFNLRIKVWDGASSTTRYDIQLGDEDGSNWLQADKWYQCAVSVSDTAISYAINGSITPKRTITTNSPGLINLDNAAEDFWLHNSLPYYGNIPLIGHVSDYPSVAVGASAFSTTALDLTDQTVLDRIFDSSGDFKNPGENGSLWFGDYGDDIPEIFAVDGSPRIDNGSYGQLWTATDGGGSGAQTAPGGLKKMYP